MSKMVRRTKRCSYVTESDTSSEDDVNYYPSDKRRKSSAHVRNTETSNTSIINGTFQKNGSLKDSKLEQDFLDDFPRKMKCTTKNALMARENRKRKKIYIENLEAEVSKLKEEKGKLTSILDNQSFVIAELRKEIKYMKSVLANSSDISNLIKNIHCNTGMSVTTSLDKTPPLNNDCVSKRKVNISRKTAHPWDDQSKDVCHEVDIPNESLWSVSPMSDISENLDFSEMFTDLSLPIDIDIPISDFPFNFDENDETPSICESSDGNSCQNSNSINTSNTWNEHNYTNIFTNNCETNEDDVGVCLHVSKHRVSIEFCPSCSENAGRAWKEVV